MALIHAVQIAAGAPDSEPIIPLSAITAIISDDFGEG
jgi:hypothetical protein